MAKSGLLSKNVPTKRSDFLLNKEIAATLAKRIENDGKLFTEEHWKTNKGIIVGTSEGEIEVKPKTYQMWIVRSEIVPGTNVTLRQYLKEAKERRLDKLHRDQQNKLVRDAQNYLAKLQALPLGTRTVKKSSKKGYNDRDGDYHETSEEIVETPINPSMVAQKRMGSTTILERLDPAYSPKQERKNLNVTVSLKDLREAHERNKKQPDYEQ